LDPAGAGALRVAFEQLRDRLKASGLFAAELKRPLPMFPRRVGIVTSKIGVAIRDIINVISRRTRTVHVLFSPAKVQGEGAGADIARAIRLINQHHDRALAAGRNDDAVDVLIVGRGGGSTEDLWAFNLEEVARAIRGSQIPVISAVGHETDFTIADFVADLRAPTPSAAAELVASHEDEICARLDQLGTNLERLLRYKVMDGRSRVQQQVLSPVFDEVRDQLRDARLRTARSTHELHTLMNLSFETARRRTNALIHQLSPAQLRARYSTARARFDTALGDCTGAMEVRLDSSRKQLAIAAASLDALSPLSVLQRGYAIARDQEGQLLRDANSVRPADNINVRLARGRLACRVEKVEES